MEPGGEDIAWKLNWPHGKTQLNLTFALSFGDN